MVSSYRKNPVSIRALQWNGFNVQEVWDWIGADNFYGPLPVGDPLAPNGRPARLYVAANDAWLDLEPGEWIIQDKLGYYPCKDSQFKEIYSANPNPELDYLFEAQCMVDIEKRVNPRYSPGAALFAQIGFGQQLKRIADMVEKQGIVVNVVNEAPKDLHIEKNGSFSRIAEGGTK